MTTTKAQKSALARLFSATVFRELSQKGQSPLFARLLNASNTLDLQANKKITVGDAFDISFKTLRRPGARSEYIYRSAIINNILLGRHSLKTASALTEFRVGTSKADLVVLNGTSTAYEIKSDLDSLTRLESQVNNYKKVFSKVYVIAGDRHIEEIINTTPKEIGVLKLARWNRIQTIREAIENTNSISSDNVLESLRTDEAFELLKNAGRTIPSAPNTLIRSLLRKEFEDISRETLHREMVTILKKNRSMASRQELIDQLPRSLHTAALSFNIQKKNYSRLISAANTSLQSAMDWK